MKRFDASGLRSLSKEAASVSRLRKNHNFHPTASDPIQRMVNAFEPATYVRPHRHRDKWELFVIVSGRASVLTFDDSGRVLERVDLDTAEKDRVVEIPGGVWHTLVSLASQTVLFEVKAGPYVATAPEDFAAWAPAEGDHAAAAYEQRLRTAQPGQDLRANGLSKQSEFTRE